MPAANPEYDTCAQCRFYRRTSTKRNTYGCYVMPPIYSHFENDEPVIFRAVHDAKAGDYACMHFKPQLSA